MSALKFAAGTRVEDGGHGPYVQHNPTVHLAAEAFMSRPIGSWVTTTECGIRIIPSITTQDHGTNECSACFILGREIES